MTLPVCHSHTLTVADAGRPFSSDVAAAAAAAALLAAAAQQHSQCSAWPLHLTSSRATLSVDQQPTALIASVLPLSLDSPFASSVPTSDSGLCALSVMASRAGASAAAALPFTFPPAYSFPPFFT